MKQWQATFATFAALLTSIALADDFKTIDGKEYKNVTVSRVEPDGLVLTTKTGISKVYFVELPEDNIRAASSHVGRNCDRPWLSGAFRNGLFPVLRRRASHSRD